jgi:hypothetical protein
MSYSVDYADNFSRAIRCEQPLCTKAFQPVAASCNPIAPATGQHCFALVRWLRNFEHGVKWIAA